MYKYKKVKNDDKDHFYDERIGWIAAYLFMFVIAMIGLIIGIIAMTRSNSNGDDSISQHYYSITTNISQGSIDSEIILGSINIECTKLGNIINLEIQSFSSINNANSSTTCSKYLFSTKKIPNSCIPIYNSNYVNSPKFYFISQNNDNNENIWIAIDIKNNGYLRIFSDPLDQNSIFNNSIYWDKFSITYPYNNRI
jgi:hypothetical protein